MDLHSYPSPLNLWHTLVQYLFGKLFPTKGGLRHGKAKAMSYGSPTIIWPFGDVADTAAEISCGAALMGDHPISLFFVIPSLICPSRLGSNIRKDKLISTNHRQPIVCPERRLAGQNFERML